MCLHVCLITHKLLRSSREQHSVDLPKPMITPYFGNAFPTSDRSLHAIYGLLADAAARE